MEHTVENIQRWTKEASNTILDSKRQLLEVRALSLIAGGFFMYFIAESIFYLLGVPLSTIALVTTTATVPLMILFGFVLALILITPYMFCLVMCPKYVKNAFFKRLASLSAVIAAIIWMQLATLAIPLDIGPVEIPYGIRCVFSIIVGLTFSMSVNTQQIRETNDAKTCI